MVEEADIKMKLVEEYEKYSETYFDNIKHIFKTQGKHNIEKRIVNKQDITREVLKKSYYLTNIDIWLLSKIYDLPIVLISSKPLLEHTISGALELERNILILNEKIHNNYFFIRPPAVRNNESPIYRLFHIDSNPRINIALISSTWKTYIIENSRVFTLDGFIEQGDKVKKFVLKIKE